MATICLSKPDELLALYRKREGSLENSDLTVQHLLEFAKYARSTLVPHRGDDLRSRDVWEVAAALLSNYNPGSYRVVVPWSTGLWPSDNPLNGLKRPKQPPSGSAGHGLA